MRYTVLNAPLLLTLAATAALAQRPPRDSVVHVEVRWWSGDGRGDLRGDLAEQIERIARTIIEKRAFQEQLARRFQVLGLARLSDVAPGLAPADSDSRIRLRRDLATQIHGVSRSL